MTIQKNLFSALSPIAKTKGLIQKHGGIDFNAKREVTVGYMMHEGNRYAICEEKKLARLMPLNTGYASYVIKDNEFIVMGV